MIAGSISAHAVALEAARKFDAHCVQLPAPILVDSPETAKSLKSEMIIQRVLKMAKRCDIALSGVGPVSDMDSSYYKANFLTEEDFNKLEKYGAVGSLLGRFFDINGKECETEFKYRVIALDFDAYKKIPERIVFAGGEHKLDAIYALASSGVITTLVTDSNTAVGLIEKIQKKRI